MTIGKFLAAATMRLEAAGISTARLDCLVLLEDVLGIGRTQLLAQPETELTQQQQKTLDALIARRVTHEPLAYIRNTTEFYGRDFYLDHHVLEPRPESETIIDLLKSLALPDKPIIIDVGTGSGALAITAKLELPTAVVTGVDVDQGCLNVASKNAKTLQADVRLIQSDLLRSLASENFEIAVLLCNLPYVPDTFQINPAAMREPRLAIFGGPDGLDLYRRLFSQIDAQLNCPLHILTEAMPPQHPTLTDIARSAGYQLETTSDFIQVFRKS